MPWGLTLLLVALGCWALLAFAFGLAFGLGRELALQMVQMGLLP